MRKTYVRVIFSSEGESPKQVIERMMRIGATPVGGDYDFEFSLSDDERIFDRIEKIHNALKGARVRYSITTRLDVGEEVHGSEGRRRIVHYFDQKPVEMKKAVYRAKLDRWKEMGLDVSEIEPLLEQNLEKFKEASKQFLRTHLDEMAEVKDKHPPENLMDGEILARIDESGKTLSQLVTDTGYSEDFVILSLGRLISAGSVRRVLRGSAEAFCLVPPPAPQLRKALVILPANSVEEARKRVYDAIPPEGISAKDLVKAARLPREQLARAIEALVADGRVKVSKDQKRAMYFRA
ncbi:MAG: hypothetical protein A3K67_04545 [Euryarchaeota archaeon RBG_16_62_10]|nr:MAG: hypothetical protein A3K67_04545 [Euryarchaeota archaeon RBG_16_62_10]